MLWVVLGCVVVFASLMVVLDAFWSCRKRVLVCRTCVDAAEDGEVVSIICDEDCDCGR